MSKEEIIKELQIISDALSLPRERFEKEILPELQANPEDCFLVKAGFAEGSIKSLLIRAKE